MNEGINDIQLNNILLSHLYGRAIVHVNDSTASARPEKQPAAAPQAAPAEPEKIVFLGNNAKNITVLVKNADFTFLPEDQLAFLTRILGACKLNMGDVAIVNTFRHNHIPDIIDQLRPSTIISFDAGLNGQDLPVTSNTSIINGPPLAMLVADTPDARSLKAALWNSLKQTFGL